MGSKGVTVENTGNVTWYADGDDSSGDCSGVSHQTVLAYRWSGVQSNFDDGAFVNLGQDIASDGPPITINMEITAPEASGERTLLFNLKKKDCMWFNGSNETYIASSSEITTVKSPTICLSLMSQKEA